MKGAKLVKILKTLNKEEWKYLRWFTQSNFFNTDAKLLALYEALARHYPMFESKAMDKELVFSRVFPNFPFDDAKWRNLLLKMNKLLEDYLVWLEIEKEGTTRQKLLVAAYGRRNLYQQFENSTDELLVKLDHQSRQAADAQREKALLNLQFYHHQQTSRIDNRERLKTASDDLDIYYCAEKLRVACDMKVFENVVQGEAPVRFANEMLGFANEHQTSGFGYLGLYAKMYQLLDEDSTTSQFQAAYAYFMTVADELSFFDKQFGLLHLLNYAINQTNKGEAIYRGQVLKLYKLGLDWEVLLVDGKISANTFINIASNGAALGEFGWTASFINLYDPKLDPVVKEEAKSIGLGYLSFFKKDYDSTIQLLRSIQFQDFNFELTSKMLLIRSYYGLFERDHTYYNLLSANSRALAKFLQRNKLLPEKKRGWYLNFESMLSKLARMVYQGNLNKKGKSSLIREVENKEMVLKPWLLEKIQG